MATFGQTTNNASTQTFSGDRIYLSTATPASSGTLTGGYGRASVSGASSPGTRLVVYADSAGAPGALLATSDETIVSNTTEALITYTFSGAEQISIVSGTPYWFGFMFDDPGTPNFVMSRANTAGVVHFGSVTYPSAPNPFSSGGTAAGPHDVYLEYSTSTNVSTTATVKSVTASIQTAVVTAVKNVSTAAAVLAITASLFAPTITAVAPPTIVLNTIDAYDFGSDDTPTLEFTGTDPTSDDIRYNVQIDTANTFESQLGAIDGSYSETNSNTSTQIGGNPYGISQSFQSSGGQLGSIQFYINRLSTGEAGNVVAKIYAHSGTFGTSSIPTGATLATSDAIVHSTLPTSQALVTFSFTGANRISLAAATQYVVTIEFTASGTGRINVGVDNTSPTHAGNSATYNGTTWTSGSSDASFYARLIPVPLLDKLSGTDTGFVNTINGGDSDPFTSGEKVSYTVQSALATGTYYWRARAKDPSGSNTYSSWATTRSFVISGGTSVSTNASVQALTFSTQVPTVTAIKNANFTATVQAAAFSTVAPTVTAVINVSVSATIQNAVFAIQTPTVGFGISTTVSVQSVVVSSQPPTVSTTENVSASPTVQSAVFSAISPTVTTTRIVDTAVSAQSATFTTIAPTVTAVQSISVAANTVTASFSYQAGSITGIYNVNIPATVQSTAFTVQSPSVSVVAHLSVSVSAQSVTFSVIAPTVDNSSNVSVNASVVSASFAAQSPTVSTTQSTSVSVNTQSATFAAQSPTITTTQSITVSSSVQTITAQSQSPTVQAVRNAIISVDTQTVTFNVQAGSATTTRNENVAVSLVTATFNVQSPIVTTTTQVVATPNTAQIAVSTLSPTVSTQISTTVNASVQIVNFSIIIPSIDAERNAPPYPYHPKNSPYTKQNSPYTKNPDSPYTNQSSPYSKQTNPYKKLI